MSVLLQWYDRVAISHLGPDASPKLNGDRPDDVVRWQVAMRDGFWQAGSSAGGSFNWPG